MAQRQRTRKAWETADIMLQQLYGLSGFEMGKASPTFGSSIAVELHVGSFGSVSKIERKGAEMSLIREVETQMLPPTLFNLAWHFGHMDWAVNNMLNLIRQSRGRITESDLDARFFTAAFTYAKEDFERKRVLPHRRALEQCNHPVYLYCIPAKVVETDLTTGQYLMQEGDYVLCVLPKSIGVAKHYNLTDGEIKLLAPQVLWLLKQSASRKLLRSGEELVRLAADWVRYVNPATAGHWLDRIQEINDQLVTVPVRRTLGAG